MRGNAAGDRRGNPGPPPSFVGVSDELRGLVLTCLDEAAAEVEVPALVFVDIEAAGEGAIPRLALLNPRARIIAFGSRAEVGAVVQAIRSGAFDFLVAPPEPGRLREAIVAAGREVRPPATEATVPPSLVGDSLPMRALAAQIRRVQQNDVVVSLRGETGTGKELVARAIHDGGPRQKGPFVAINCAAIPRQLHESELFGHERGSFTGAVRLHRGCFEQANGGTLFLDEVAEMSPSTQASLLRALEERRIRRVGGTVDVPVDIRVICATHRDLVDEVRAGRFRQDLYFRIVVYPIELAPLRDRAADIGPLMRHFFEKFGGSARRHRLNRHALDALTRYPWPGNVRELENVARRILIASDGLETIGLEHLPHELQAHSPPEGGAPAAEDGAPVLPFRELERRAISRALAETSGNIDEAARLLGMSRATLYRRLARTNGPRRKLPHENAS